MIKRHYPVTIDSSYYAAVGEVAVRFAWLEHRLHVLIREGLRITKSAGRITLVGKDARVLADILQTIAESAALIPDATLRSKLAQYARDIDAKSKQRANYVHGVYGTPPADPFKLYRIILKGQMDTKGERFTPKSVTQLVSHLTELQERGLQLTKDLKALRKGTKS